MTLVVKSPVNQLAKLAVINVNKAVKQYFQLHYAQQTHHIASEGYSVL